MQRNLPKWAAKTKDNPVNWISHRSSLSTILSYSFDYFQPNVSGQSSAKRSCTSICSTLMVRLTWIFRLWDAKCKTREAHKNIYIYGIYGTPHTQLCKKSLSHIFCCSYAMCARVVKTRYALEAAVLQLQSRVIKYEKCEDDQQAAQGIEEGMPYTQVWKYI